MKKRLLVVSVGFLLLVLPGALRAQDVQLTASETIQVTLTSPSVTYTLSSSTGINSLEASDSTLTLTLDAGDTVIVTQDNGYDISNNLSVTADCVGTIARATFTQTVVITSGTASRGCSTGGGGSNPVTDVSITINDGASQTASRNVSLKLHAVNASGMILSNQQNFADAQWETYAETKSWVLTEGLGEKTVFVNYRSSSGDQSAPISDVIILTAAPVSGGQTSAPSQTPSTPSTPSAPSQTPAAPSQPSTVSEGALVKAGDDPRVYLISNGLRRWIRDERTFIAQGYRWDRITVVSADVLNHYRDGQRIESAEPVSAARTYRFTRYLASGSVGTEVRELQKVLKALGFFPKQQAETGYFGQVTRTAVINFQKAKKLNPIGVVGPMTRAALNAQ